MSVWQFFAYVDGWIKANNPAEGLSKEEQDDIWKWLQTQPDEVKSFNRLTTNGTG